MTLAIIFDNIVMCCASVGSSLELFILIFLVFNFKNKVSIFSSSYFRLLAVGYFIDLIFFSPLAAFTLLSVDDTYFTMFTKRYCELYVVLFIGPWNLALCLNRLSSIAFVNKHQSLWSNKKLIFLHILLFAFPFIISTFSFLQAECKSLVDSDGCFDFIYENFYIISVSNGIFIFSSLGTGISTFVVLSRKNKRNSVINLKIKHTKIERNLLLQSFISSIFYGSFCISLAVYPYFSSHRHISSTNYAAYNTVIFLENILYMLFHYSSFISLLVFSPTMRSNLIKFYHLHIFTCQNHRRPALSSIIFLANKKISDWTAMFLLHFNAPETLHYNYSDIYSSKLQSILMPIMHYTSITTVVLSAILIYIIMKKTPKTMKFFKTYLIPYVFNTLALEIVMLCFKPYIMHPFFAIYSLELGNFLSTKFLMMLFILMSFFAMQLIDCIVGMSAERYFAIKNIRTGHSKTPLIIFLILSGSSLVYLIVAMIAVQFQSVRESLILSENEVLDFFEEHFKDAITIINPASVLIIRPDIPVQKFAMGFGIFVSFVFSRYIAAIVLLILNATNTQMPNMERMSEKLKKNNKMLLKCIFAQFFGFFTLAGLPAFIIVLNFYLLSEPNVIIPFCFLFMNCFGLYDIFVTVICVKPYRDFIVKVITYVKRKSLRFLKNKVDPKAASDPRKPSIFITKLFDTSSDMHSKTIR